MSITLRDLERISQKIHEQKEKFNRDFFALFEKADYDRGDRIVLSQDIADGIKLQNSSYDKEKISVSPYLKTGSYVILVGETKKPRLEFNSDFYPVLKSPKSIINTNCN